MELNAQLLLDFLNSAESIKLILSKQSTLQNRSFKSIQLLIFDLLILPVTSLSEIACANLPEQDVSI